MGRIYREQLERKIEELGAAEIRAYVNPDGFEREYREHIDETLQDLGVTVVLTREQANFVLDGRAHPQFSKNNVTAYLAADERRMIFAGTWA
jgi:hypothetical protein